TVAYALNERRNLADLSLEELKRFGGNAVDDSVFDVLTLEGSVAARNHFGGTAPARYAPPSPAPGPAWPEPARSTRGACVYTARFAALERARCAGCCWLC